MKESNRRRRKKLTSILTSAKKKQGGCARCPEKNLQLLEFAHFNSDCKYKTKNGKKICISNLNGLQAVSKELERGRFLCIFCHRIETAEAHDVNKSVLRLIDLVESSKRGSVKCSGYFCRGLGRAAENFHKNSNKKNGLQNSCIYCNIYKTIVRRARADEYIKQRKLLIGECVHCKMSVHEDNCILFDFDHLRDKLVNVSKIRQCSVKKIDEEIEKCQLLCAKCHFKKTHPHLFNE